MTSSDAFPSFHLAALAAAAIDGLRIRQVGAAVRTDDVTSAQLMDEEGRKFIVTAAHSAESGMSLLTESRILQMMAPRTDEGLSVARPAGRYSQGSLAAVVYHDDECTPLGDGELESDAAVRFLVGQAIAKIHLIPASELEDTGLPFLEAAQVRERKLNLLDAAAGTGRVPAVLLSRWETVLDEAGLWRFTPTPVHGDLHEDRFARHGEGLRVSGWSTLSVGDPAEDFAWIMSLPQESRQQVFNSYYIATATKGHPRDTSLEKRALFNAEFAVAEYLMTAVRQHDDQRIESATSLLADLANRLEKARATHEASRPPARSSHTTSDGSERASGAALPNDSNPPVRILPDEKDPEHASTETPAGVGTGKAEASGPSAAEAAADGPEQAPPTGQVPIVNHPVAGSDSTQPSAPSPKASGEAAPTDT